jgi:hypothetical protein
MTKYQLYPALQVANDLNPKIRLIPIRPSTLKNKVFLSGVPRQYPQWRQIAKVSTIDAIIFGAFLDQRLPCVDKNGLPLPIPTIPSEFSQLHVSKRDVNKLLSAAGYRMIWEPKLKRTSRKISTQEISWKLQIQIEATARCKRLYISGANPSKTDLADSMASFCKKNNIKTNTGSFPSKGYIRTHVLGGMQWKLPPKP